MTEYIAMTTYNYSMEGFTILAIAPTKEQAETEALARIDADHPDRTDIFNDTSRKNLVVVSKSHALRQGWISQFRYDQWFEVEAFESEESGA